MEFVNANAINEVETNNGGQAKKSISLSELAGNNLEDLAFKLSERLESYHKLVAKMGIGLEGEDKRYLKNLKMLIKISDSLPRGVTLTELGRQFLFIHGILASESGAPDGFFEAYLAICKIIVNKKK